jgi:hypothetical protein
VLVAHDNVCEEPVFAFGTVPFEFTVVVEVAEQPLAGSLTVTVYVPVTSTVGVAVFPPEIIPGPDQLKETPDVEEEPFSETAGIVQVNV